jgi:hypothetical protein
MFKTNKCCGTCPSIGTFSRLSYDNCAFDKRVEESVSPLAYRTSRFQYENIARCTYDGTQYAPFDTAIVDSETELKGITRPNSRCPNRKYNKNCKKSDICTNTFDSSVPVVYPAWLCPVVYNNIRRNDNVGYVVNNGPYCGN